MASEYETSIDNIATGLAALRGPRKLSDIFSDPRDHGLRLAAHNLLVAATNRPLLDELSSELSVVQVRPIYERHIG